MATEVLDMDIEREKSIKGGIAGLQALDGDRSSLDGLFGDSLSSARSAYVEIIALSAVREALDERAKSAAASGAGQEKILEMSSAVGQAMVGQLNLLSSALALNMTSALLRSQAKLQALAIGKGDGASLSEAMEEARKEQSERVALIDGLKAPGLDKVLSLDKPMDDARKRAFEAFAQAAKSFGDAMVVLEARLGGNGPKLDKPSAGPKA